MIRRLMGLDWLWVAMSALLILVLTAGANASDWDLKETDRTRHSVTGIDALARELPLAANLSGGPLGGTDLSVAGIDALADKPLLAASPNGGHLEGTDLDEVFLSGPSPDTFTGGGGEDEFVFQGTLPLINHPAGARGGFGGSDVITDYEAIAGTGDIISLRRLTNNTRIDVLNNASGNAMIVLSTLYFNPHTGLETGLQDPEFPFVDLASGALVLPGNTFQTIEVIGVTAATLMNEGRLKLNDVPLGETSPGVSLNFGAYSYVIGSENTNLPIRPGVPGNTFIDFVGGNDLVFGSFITEETIAAKLKHIAGVLQKIVIPGTKRGRKAALFDQFVIGKIPPELLPRNAFAFALEDLQAFSIDPVNRATVDDDTIIGGPGNDFLIGGPGNDIIIGGPGTDLIWAGQGQDVVIGVESVDYIIFDQITDFRDRDDVNNDGNALPDARLGYIRLAEGYGADLTDPLTTQTGPDIILVNSEAFNRGIDPVKNSELASQMGYLVPGTILRGDGKGPAATKNGQLKVGEVTVPSSDGPAEDDQQPTFYYSTTAGRLFFDRDGTGPMFTDFWMADMAIGTVLPKGAPSAAPNILIVVY